MPDDSAAVPAMVRHLRGAELGITTDATSLRGAIVTPAQLTEMAPVLAASLGIVVED